MRKRYNRALAHRARTSALQLRAAENLIEEDLPVVTEDDRLATSTEPPIHGDIEAALDRLRKATRNTPYETNLWIVGGYVRDKLLSRSYSGTDADIVTVLNALELAHHLDDIGVSQIKPVVYARFGTAMVRIENCDIELVTARKESYPDNSRKPSDIEPASLIEDAQRRDFTINTLLENLHTGEIVDPLGQGQSDLALGVLRTPMPPDIIFSDDPLRMLRAVRFAGRLNFNIAPIVWDGILSNCAKLRPPKVSFERIRDEFSKILMAEQPSLGLELLRRSNLLMQFAPELCEMVGVTQNEFHSLPVWDHTLLAIDNLIRANPKTDLVLRLATLLHDVGKPATKSVGTDGRIHFYEHQAVGASIARKLLTRLKFSNEAIIAVTQLVAQHMRIGEYQPSRWSDSAVRRLIRDSGEHLDDLFDIHRADVSALSPDHQDMSRAEELRGRIERLESEQPVHLMISPLTGDEIMEIVGLSPGPKIGEIKEWLGNETLEGRLQPGDKKAAIEAVKKRFTS